MPTELAPPLPIDGRTDPYHCLFEANPQPMWLVDRETLQFTGANDAVARLYGYSRDAFLRMSLLDIQCEWDAPRFLQAWDAPRGLSGKWNHVTRQGTPLTVELLRTAVNFRGVEEELVVCRDLTVEERVRILADAVEQSPVSIMLADLQGRIEYVNSRMCEITGYRADELIGQNPRILQSGEVPAEKYRNLWATLSSGGEWRGVFHNKKKNGHLFWEAASIRPIRNTSGAITHYLAIKEDITARREIEAALKESEERFRIAATNSSDVIYEWDLASDRTRIFGGNRGQLGVSAETHPKTSDEYRRMVHPDDLGRLLSAVDRHLQTGAPFSEEYRVVLPEGAIRFVSDEGGAVRDAAGTPYKWIGVIRDITAQRTAELALSESEERLRLITETISEVFWMADTELTRMFYISPAYERIWGRSRESLYRNPRSFLDALHPDDADRTFRSIQNQQANGLPFEQEYRILHPDGSTRWIWDHGFPLRDTTGKVTRYVGIARDITPRKELERQLSQAQRLESIGQLAAGIAHEINTPIQYIGDNGYFLQTAFQDLLGLFEAQPPAASAQQELDYLRKEVPAAIEQLLDGVNRVAVIVHAMKEFSHPGTIEKTPLDLNRAIEGTVIVSHNEWKYVAELTTDLDPSLPPVPFVSGEFNQVMLNLIVNAAHAIAAVYSEGGPKGSIHVSTRGHGSSVEIRVSDTGCGIPEAIRPKVFDPFFTTKPVGKGTGQGLAIAHSIVVQKHGGSIQIESEVGVGTTFLLQIPVTND